MLKIIWLTFEMLAVLICLHGLYGEKIKWNINTLCFIFVDLLIFLAETILGHTTYMKVFMFILFFIYAKMQFRCSWKISVLNFILCIIICSVVQLLCYFPVMLWYELLHNIISFTVNSLMLIAVFGICKSGILLKISHFMQQKAKIVCAILLFLFLVIMATMYRFGISGKIHAYDYAILILGSVLLFFLLFLLQKEKMTNRQMEAERNLSKLYGDALQELIDKVRMNQHNYRDQLTAIQGMIYTADNLEELKEEQKKYFNAIAGKDKYYQILSGNNDPVIAGFLYSKLCSSEAEQVQFDIDVHIGRIDNSLLVADIVKILGVLIDNALEETAKYANRKVEIKICENEGIHIEVSNVCRVVSGTEMVEFFKKGNSSKGENRGLGLYSIKEIVKKWNGEISPGNRKDNEVNWFYIFVHIADK